ncbi:MAG TPA: hypothetical protein VF054_19555 [Micromonosporaceae bacterium]
MSSRSGDNDGRPPDGGGLPDLPPEWGSLVIPDDPRELAGEANEVRRQLRRQARRNRWRRRLRLPARTVRSYDDNSALGVPLLIMAIAIMATLTSLFAIVWPGDTNRPLLHGTTVVPLATAPADLPDITLVGKSNQPVRLHESLPAVVLLVDGCDCGKLAEATREAVPAGVTVFAVARSDPATTLPPGTRVRSAADPEGALAAMYRPSSTTPGTATALVVRGNGSVASVVGGVSRVDDLRAQLKELR